MTVGIPYHESCLGWILVVSVCCRVKGVSMIQSERHASLTTPTPTETDGI